MNHPTATDFYGQPLAKGDRIVYPVGLGSSGVGISEAIVDGFEFLIPVSPKPTERYGWKQSEMHKPIPARKEVELPTTWDERVPNPYHGGYGAYVFDATKLFKLRIRTITNMSQHGYTPWREINGRRYSIAEKPTWLKNVQNVVRSPEPVQ